MYLKDRTGFAVLAACALLMLSSSLLASVWAWLPALGCLAIGYWIGVRLSISSTVVEGEQLQGEHALLVESIESCPIPFAVYDADDRLVAWNIGYERCYPRTFTRQGVHRQDDVLHYGDLVRDNAKNTLHGAELEAYVLQRVSAQRSQDGDVSDRHYPDLGWLRISKHVTSSGGVAGFAIDINELKHREAELIEEIEQRKRLEVTIRKLANTDPLSGIGNRRWFMDRSDALLDLESVPDSSICLLMIDIDHFKAVNDTHGHAAGDEVITTVAGTIASCARADEDDSGARVIVARLGGEEFGVLLIESDRLNGPALAERICRSTRALSFNNNGQCFTVSLSVGVAHCTHGCDMTTLLSRADEALYRAKAEGRDQVQRAA